MLFRNSLRLLLENFKNVYKILLYKFVVGLVAGALCCAMVLPELIELWNSAPMQELIDGVNGFFKAFFAADAEGLQAVKDQLFGEEGTLHNVVKLVLSKTTGIVLATVGCVVVYLFKRFADTLCYFAVGGVLNDKMSTYTETPLSTSYLTNIGKGCRYALVYVPIAFAFDVLAVGLCYVLIRYVNILPALFLSMTTIVLLQSLKLTFTGRWMPAMTADQKRLRDSVKYEDKTERKQRLKIFSTNLTCVYGVIIVNVMAAIATIGSALIITVPASYFLFICVQYAYYYTIKGKKYFITYERIASNPDRGDREHFFNYIDATQEEK
ncbi:MAG: hypothetical protein IJX96_02965 [Clostridia bacterium]|nr:hypothetical protein [Clostridia bacterium]